jgi:dsDNA-specific endonuclease/ATPase MutS2
MIPPPAVGDPVHTPLGKGVVREVRARGCLLVEIAGRKVVFDAAAVKPLEPDRKPSRGARAAVRPASATDDAPARERHGAPNEVDLHGLTVADALTRVEIAISDALLAGHLQLRLIHGRSGGRIKAAVHRQLRALPPVRAFRVDVANEGVTVVEL